MLDLEAIRIPEELHYRNLLAHHPGLVTLRSRLGQEWDRFATAHVLPAGARGSVISSTPGQEAWAAAAEVVANLGIYVPVELILSNRPLGPLEACGFVLERDRIKLSIPGEALSLFTGAELKAGIAHILGHGLLGHCDANDVNAVVTIATSNDPLLTESLRSETNIANLLRLARILAQLQELSADRAALAGCRDFDAAAAVAFKLTYGRSSTPVSVEETLRMIEPVQDDPVWTERDHPYGPNRLLALLLASEIDLRIDGPRDGAQQRSSPLHRLLPKLVPLVDREDYRPKKIETETERIDRYLLELILIDTVAVTNSHWDIAAERLIDQLIPQQYYDKVMNRYDRLSNDADSDQDMLVHWLKKASRRPTAWKRGMVERLLHTFGSETLVSDQALAEVSWLAQQIDAPFSSTAISPFAGVTKRSINRKPSHPVIH